MNPRGRRTATALLVFVIAMLIACGVAFRRTLLVEWTIWRLGSDDVGVQAHAAQKLRELRSVRALPALFERVVEGRSSLPEKERLGAFLNSGVKILCSEAIEGLGEDAVPFLVGRLADPDATARRVSARLLRRLGPRARGAVDALARVVRDRNEQAAVRRRAVLALGSIGPDAAGALTALRSAGDEIDHAAAREAIERIEADYD